ncbi:MAG: transglutaminase-like domain-containing protein [Dehalococcoidia bacterium]|nr:transglutaminase-like domain-containing protein [Dehalococcoidia bacterium]
MKRGRVLPSLIVILLAGLATAGYASASPSEGFQEINGDVFDDWEVCRTRAFGEDGFYQISETTFRPVIVFESLGENAALAYSLGEQIANEYSDRVQRAEAVFRFVRDRVKYTPDTDQFDHEEFALNADELATSIDQNGVGYGDCEDSAVLLAVMYKGAGYRSAIVVGSGHTATLVYLPEYSKATAIFELDGKPGWVWAEATGRKNPLGWTSKEFINVKLAAYEISEELIASAKPSAAPVTAIAPTGAGGSARPFPFISIIGLLWLMSMFRRRRVR